MRIHIPVFGGAALAREPHLLAAGQAREAVDVKLGSGALAPFRAPAPAAELPPRGHVKRLTLLSGSRWLSWTREVETALVGASGSGVAGGRERLVVTGLDAPRVIDPDAAFAQETPVPSRLLGVAAPAARPQAQAGSGGSGSLRSVAYAHTFVTSFGEEGPPSPPSPVIEARDGQRVDVFNLSPVPAGDTAITKRRVYRTATPESGSAVWRFVAEIPAGATSYTDQTVEADLGEVLGSALWYPPPRTLRGVVAMPNGFLAGFSGNEICLSEPFAPHAWPPNYRLATDWPVKALGVFGTTLVAATAGHPYLVTATHPAAASMARLPDRQPCLSARGLASAPDGVLYPSPDGLYHIGTRGGGVITRELISRDAWQALRPRSLHGTVQGGRYFGFHEAGAGAGWGWADVGPEVLGGALAAGSLGSRAVNGSRLDGLDIEPPDVNGGGFILGLSDEAEGGAGLTFLSTYAYACAAEASASAQDGDDHLYCVTREAGRNVVGRFDAGDGLLPYLWRSGDFLAPSPLNFGAARLEGDFADGPALFRLYADGALAAEREVDAPRPFRLPAGFAARRFALEISGTARVLGATLALTLAELGDG